jgi:hypothetical protein
MEKRRYVVEGAWDEGNEGSPITVDWIAATSAEEAEAIVTKVRGKIDDWTHDATRTFEAYLESQQRILDDMRTKTIEEVEASWAETKEGLYYEEDEEEDEEEAAGQCLTCGTQCSDEGICPLCAALELAEDADDHTSAQKALDAAIESCRKCGTPLKLRDVVAGNACTDSGDGPEQGKVFVYCSEHCRKTH